MTIRDVAPETGAGKSTLLEGLGVLVVCAGSILAATHTNHTAPILAFAGAIIVAALAAVTAGRRQRDDLKEAHRRLQTQLGEQRRLEETSHLREVLDDAAALYQQALRSYNDLVFSLITDSRERNEHSNAAFKAAARVDDAQGRILLRFPPGHPIAKAYGRVSAHLRDGLSKSFDEHAAGKEPPGMGTALGAVQEAFDDFAGAARERVGPRSASGAVAP